MKILAIETSCDETASAVVQDGYRLLSNVVASSVDLHKAYGGVVPEIAARSHIESIIPVIEEALKRANTSLDEVDALAVTEGPGLSGSLLIGIMAAKSLAIASKKPLYAINHVTAHPYAAFITSSTDKSLSLPKNSPPFPSLALIVSGGHSQLVLFKNHFDYKVLGQTLDDAVGEAFDKVAKIVGLPYPGGPSIAKAAQAGDPKFMPLPAIKTSSAYDFSFSGLKTAVLRATQELCGKKYDFPSSELAGLLNSSQRANIAASFQSRAVSELVGRTLKAYKEFSPLSIIVAGGVAANQELRAQLDRILPVKPYYPDIRLCTDNAAMIATLAYFAYETKQPTADPYILEPLPSLSM